MQQKREHGIFQVLFRKHLIQFSLPLLCLLLCLVFHICQRLTLLISIINLFLNIFRRNIREIIIIVVLNSILIVEQFLLLRLRLGLLLLYRNIFIPAYTVILSAETGTVQTLDDTVQGITEVIGTAQNIRRVQ